MNTFYKIFLIGFFLISQKSYSDDENVIGELIFHPINLGSQTFSINITTSEYCWTWDKINQKTVLHNSYSFSRSGLTATTAFDEPKDESGANLGTIPYGNFNITLSSGNKTLTFRLDLRDEDWSQVYPKYWTHDTYINFNFITESVFLSQGASKDIYNSNDPMQYDIKNSFHHIWSYWSPGSSAIQSNFTIPVMLFNRLENQSFDFGFLYANSNQVNSGNPAQYSFSQNNSIQVGTIEYYYSNLKYYNFNWSNQFITPDANSNQYQSLQNFTIQYSQNNKSITRNFRTVYPLTIKNNLVESNLSSVGEVLFKDPTTDNQFHSYSAAGNGFVKNEAFYDLHIDLPPLTEQKYSIKAISPFIYNSRKYYWYNGDFNPTTQTDLLITGAITKTANYKGTQLSNQTNAIVGNGQKKLVKTSDGYLHHTYESLNKVWYERSTDNGTTWEIMNGGKHVSGSYNSKQPSVDYYNTAAGKVLVIVYQAYDNNGSSVNASVFKDGALVNTYVVVTYSHSIGVINEVNTTSVVSINPDGKLLIMWYLGGAQDVIFNSPAKGIYYRYANLYFGASGVPLISWFTSLPVQITRTSITSINPTLDAYKISAQSFQLAYENNNQIYYQTLTDDANQTTHISVSNSQNISTGSGYTYNIKPSILAWNGGSRVVWEGNNSGYKKRVIFRSPGTSYFWSFNNSGGAYDCLNPNINRPDNYSTYYFSWSENNAGIMNNNSLSYTGIKNLGISGQYIQLSNGATPGAMYATTLNSSAAPYYFTKSASLGSFYGLSKSSGIIAGSEGRRGVVYKDSAEFYFNFGKITVDDNNIGYVQIDESKDTLDEKTINQYLVSQPFNINDNSSFTFNIQYGVTDTVNANAVLEDNDYVSFKLQLVDYATSAILGEYDNVKFTKSNLSDHNNLDYLVNTKGIGNKTVILKLVVETNFEASYALTLENSGGANENLNKENYKEISYNDGATVTDYDLAQNYPNPFNPSTTISYQLPQDGMVTLKIYDILGSEIATLVNEEKPAGKYEVNFNASSLASGVYIYKIQSGSFTASKKLMLLK